MRKDKVKLQRFFGMQSLLAWEEGRTAVYENVNEFGRLEYLQEERISKIEVKVVKNSEAQACLIFN